jgi:hypothetical protein
MCTGVSKKYDWLLQHLLNFAKWNVLGSALTYFSIAGIGLSTLKRTRQDVLLMSAWVFTYLFFSLPRWYIVPPQYLITIFPAWLLLAARFLQFIFDKVKVKTLMRLLTVGIIALPAFVYSIKSDFALTGPTSTQNAKNWIEENIPEKSRIFCSFTQSPQLTLTPEAYVRWRKIIEQSWQGGWLGGKRQDFIPDDSDRITLVTLRKNSLLNGKQYDVYFNEDFNRINDIDNFKGYLKNHGITYVVVSLEAETRLSSGEFSWLVPIKRFAAHPWMPAYAYNLGIYLVK